MIGPKVPMPTPAEERKAYTDAMNRDDHTCQRCRRTGIPMNRDHRKGRGVGGRTVVENLQLLCGTGTTGCHGYITQHPADAMREGYGVPGYIADPGTWPARRWQRVDGVMTLTWVIYLPDGKWRDITPTEALQRMDLEPF